MGTIRQNLLAKKLTKQNGSFGRARWKKSSSFTRERHQILIFTMGTTDPRKTIFQHSAIQVLAHHIGYRRRPLAVFLFEPQIVLSHKAIKVMKQYRIERSLLRVSSCKNRSAHFHLCLSCPPFLPSSQQVEDYLRMFLVTRLHEHTREFLARSREPQCTARKLTSLIHAGTIKLRINMLYYSK